MTFYQITSARYRFSDAPPPPSSTYIHYKITLNATCAKLDVWNGNLLS